MNVILILIVWYYFSDTNSLLLYITWKLIMFSRQLYFPRLSSWLHVRSPFLLATLSFLNNIPDSVKSKDKFIRLMKSHHCKPWVGVHKLSLQPCDERENRWESPMGYPRWWNLNLQNHCDCLSKKFWRVSKFHLWSDSHWFKQVNIYYQMTKYLLL